MEESARSRCRNRSPVSRGRARPAGFHRSWSSAQGEILSGIRVDLPGRGCLSSGHHHSRQAPPPVPARAPDHADLRHGSFRVASCFHYIWTIVIVSVIGPGDETLQWILPNRYFGIPDLLTNATGGFLTLVFIVFVLGKENYSYPRAETVRGGKLGASSPW